MEGREGERQAGGGVGKGGGWVGGKGGGVEAARGAHVGGTPECEGLLHLHHLLRGGRQLRAVVRRVARQQQAGGGRRAARVAAVERDVERLQLHGGGEAAQRAGSGDVPHHGERAEERAVGDAEGDDIDDAPQDKGDEQHVVGGAGGQQLLARQHLEALAALPTAVLARRHAGGRHAVAVQQPQHRAARRPPRQRRRRRRLREVHAVFTRCGHRLQLQPRQRPTPGQAMAEAV